MVLDKTSASPGQQHEGLLFNGICKLLKILTSCAVVTNAVLHSLRKGNFTLLNVIQEDQLNDSWSPAISDFDRVTNPKALREALLSTNFLHC